MTQDQASSATEPVDVPHVDAALAVTERLPETDVEAHVTAFEAAHESLRRALDDRAEPGAPGR